MATLRFASAISCLLLNAACVPVGAPAPFSDVGDVDADGAAGTADAAPGDAFPPDAGARDADSEHDATSTGDGGSPAALELELSERVITEGERIFAAVWRRADDGGREMITTELEWLIDTATVASATSLEILGRAPGHTRVRVRHDGAESNAASLTVTTQGELRGIWVSRWLYADTDDLDQIVNDASAANLNAIFLQVRGEADAFYDSAHEPWSRILSGTLGQDPGWDPLAALIVRAHAAGLQVHAWINTFPAWQSATAPIASTPEHPMRAHPEWLCANENGVPMAPGESSYQFFSPGNPEVRAHIATVLEDLGEKYEIDGLHLDYVRYPGPTYCHDAVSEAEFARRQAADPSLDWPSFQRENVATTIELVRTRLNAVRPSAVLTAATWGIYRNKWNWTSVSKGYDDYFQDAHGFVARGLLDAIVPMTYWASTAVEGERLDFAALTEDHVRAASAAGRYAFAGISAEHDGAELTRQVQIARNKGARGMVFFEIGEMRSRGHLTRLRDGPFSSPAVVPPFAFR